MNKNVLIVGGFTESKRMLEHVAYEAVDQGFGDDADTLTLLEASKMDEGRLIRVMAGMNVITHSAGVAVMPDARRISKDRELPNDLIVIAGPEPRTIETLKFAALEKTKDHGLASAKTRWDHWSVVAGNMAEYLRGSLPKRGDVSANDRLVPHISTFSTVASISGDRLAANGLIGSFMMTYDEFYRDATWRNRQDIQSLEGSGIVFAELPGHHDDLFISPINVLQGVRQAFQHAEYRR